MKNTVILSLAVLFGAADAIGYTCYARGNGGASCSGSFSGYHSSSKGLAIQDALRSCASSLPSQCSCSFDRCSDSTLGDDVVNPIGEHDHFLGTVRFLGTGSKSFPDISGLKNQFHVEWRSAKEGVRKDVTVPAHGGESVQVYAFKTKAKVAWFLNCPESDERCYCSNGTRYSAFTIGSRNADAQGFTFDVPTARIDVNDMRITRQDGSTYYAKGKYELYMEKEISGTMRTCTLVSEAATKTGLDVARGFKYRVVTQAVSEEGSTLQSTQEIDLR